MAAAVEVFVQLGGSVQVWLGRRWINVLCVRWFGPGRDPDR